MEQCVQRNELQKMGPFVQVGEAGDCGKQHELLSSAICGDVDSASATTFLYGDSPDRSR